MSKELEDLLEALPPQSREIIKELWSGLPADMRRELDTTIKALKNLLSNNKVPVSQLVTLLQRLATPALSPFSRIAILGPVNVGKSTLYNCLIGETQTQAEVSPLPGTTRENQTADLGLFLLTDTPGADHGSPVGEEEKYKALAAAQEADFFLIVFDASRSITNSDKKLYQQLLSYNKPHLIVLNKIDLIPRREQQQVIKAAADILEVEEESIVATCALHSRGIETLILEIAASEPRLLGKLGETIVPMRRKLAWQAIRRSTVAAAVVSLAPLPMMDLIPLTGIQAALVLTLARIYGYEINLQRSIELLTTFGAGWLARMAFQEASKLAGLPGWAIASAIAGSATIAIGLAAMQWFETGQKPTRKMLQHIATASRNKLYSSLKHFGRKKPSSQALTEELTTLLPELTKDLEHLEEPDTSKENQRLIE